MHLFALTVLLKDEDGKVTRLSSAYDLSKFGFFQKSSIQEFMDFTSKILVERTSQGTRQSAGEQEYMCHAYVRCDSLAAILIADQEYPQRVAFSLLNKVLDDFTSRYPSHQWQCLKTTGNIKFPEVHDLLVKYQTPQAADALTRLQGDVDETKIILHRNMEAVLDRGEKLDDLVNKSEELSLQSKAFYKTAKKANKCCIIL